ncbi:hypothetical protein BH18ACI2_BH18ACI2_26530 [soil metagenome]
MGVAMRFITSAPVCAAGDHMIGRRPKTVAPRLPQAGIADGYSAPTLRHSSAHLRHASAQRLQCSLSCLAHSAAQASQISAQSAQSFAWNFEPRLMKAAASQHASAQSMQRRAHSGFSPRHPSPQCSHSCAQRRRRRYSFGVLDVPFYFPLVVIRVSRASVCLSLLEKSYFPATESSGPSLRIVPAPTRVEG